MNCKIYGLEDLAVVLFGVPIVFFDVSLHDAPQLRHPPGGCVGNASRGNTDISGERALHTLELLLLRKFLQRVEFDTRVEMRATDSLQNFVGNFLASLGVPL